MDTLTEIEREGLLKNINWINKIYLSAVTLSLFVNILKIMGNDTFTWFDIRFSVHYTWLFFLIFSVVHFYIIFFHIDISFREVYYYASEDNYNYMRELYFKIVKTGGLFTRGLVNREKSKMDKKEYIRRLGRFLVDNGMTMDAPNLAEHLNWNNFKTSYGTKYSGKRGTYTLIHATYD